MVVMGQNWLYSKKSSFFRVKRCFIRSKWLFLGKSGCIRAKWFCSGKVVFFSKVFFSGKYGCIRVKVVVFWQKWLYRG